MGDRRNLGLLCVAAVAVAVYAPTLGHGLVRDDRLLLELAERSTRAGGLPGLLAAEFRAEARRLSGK